MFFLHAASAESRELVLVTPAGKYTLTMENGVQPGIFTSTANISLSVDMEWWVIFAL